jgi:hypothetical protein
MIRQKLTDITTQLREQLQDLKDKSNKSYQDKKKIEALEKAIKSVNSSKLSSMSDKEVRNLAFGVEQHLKAVDLLNPALKTGFTVFKFFDNGPLEATGKILGGAAGAAIGVAAGTPAAVEGGPFWGGVIGAKWGSEKGGEWGRVADEFYGFDNLGKAY